MKFIDDVYGRDMYGSMAGGAFDSTFAGGFAYSPYTLPKPNLNSVFIENELNLTALLLGLNEDFVEFVLMPMHISFLKQDTQMEFELLKTATDYIKQEHKRLTTYLKDRSNDYKYRSYGFSHAIDSNGYYKDVALAKFHNEIKNDSALENTLESLGSLVFGAMSSAIVGMAYDYFVNDEITPQNVPEAIYNQTKGLIINSAIQKTTSAIGTSLSPIGAVGLSMAINALVSEAIEVATGLDRTFGFGGDLVGAISVNDKPKSFYEADKGIIDGIKDIFGFGEKSRSLVDKSGEFAGYMDKKGRISTVSTSLGMVSVKSGRVFDGVIGSVEFESFNEFGYKSFDDFMSVNTPKSINSYGIGELSSAVYGFSVNNFDLSFSMTDVSSFVGVNVNIGDVINTHKLSLPETIRAQASFNAVRNFEQKDIDMSEQISKWREDFTNRYRFGFDLTAAASRAYWNERRALEAAEAKNKQVVERIKAEKAKELSLGGRHGFFDRDDDSGWSRNSDGSYTRENDRTKQSERRSSIRDTIDKGMRDFGKIGGGRFSNGSSRVGRSSRW